MCYTFFKINTFPELSQKKIPVCSFSCWYWNKRMPPLAPVWFTSAWILQIMLTNTGTGCFEDSLLLKKVFENETIGSLNDLYFLCKIRWVRIRQIFGLYAVTKITRMSMPSGNSWYLFLNFLSVLAAGRISAKRLLRDQGTFFLLMKFVWHELCAI